jgi:hypothetical protein
LFEKDLNDIQVIDEIEEQEIKPIEQEEPLKNKETG